MIVFTFKTSLSHDTDELC